MFIQIQLFKKRIRVDLAMMLVACVIIIGYAIRYQGVWYGLPDLLYGDEINTSDPAQTAMQGGTINYIQYFYPQTFSVFQTSAVVLVKLFRTIVGTGPNWMNHGIWEVYLIGRYVSLGMSLGSILLIFLIGRKAYNSWVGLIAATFLAFYPAFVEYSTYAKPDSGMILFVLLAIYLSLFVAERDRLSDTILAGFAVGLAAGCKYQGILAIIPLLVAYMLYSVKHHIRLWGMIFSMPILAMVISVLLGYLPGNLHQFVNLHTLLADVSWFKLIFGISSTGRLLSITNLLIAAGAVLVLLIRKNPSDLLIGSFALVAYFIVGNSRYHDQMLYYISLYILVAALAVALLQWLTARLPRFKIGLILLLLTCGAWFIYSDLLQISQILVASGYYAGGSRVQAREWVLENVPPGASILYCGPEYGGAAELPGDMYLLTSMFCIPITDFFTTFEKVEPDYVILTAHPQVGELEKSGLSLIKKFEDNPPVLFGARFFARPMEGFVEIYQSATPPELKPNLYLTLRLNEPRSSAVRSASFDDPAQVSKDWLFQSNGARLETPDFAAEVLPRGAAGSNVLHLMVSNPNGAGMVEAIQMIPRANIGEFANFRMDILPVDDEISGCCARITLKVYAQSLGGAALGEQNYHLVSMGSWDWKDSGLDVSSNIPLGAWSVFARNIRLDLERSGVRWDWVGMLVVHLQVETSHAGSAAGVYFDNIQTSLNPPEK